MRRLLALALVCSGCFVPYDSKPVDGDRACTTCHGDAARAGSRERRAAPPNDIFGNTEAVFPGVGAHEAHLRGSPLAAPVPCAECHVVPTALGDPGHNDGVTTLTFGAVANARRLTAARYDFASRRCEAACHGSQPTAAWTRPRPSEALCGTCHARRPPPPHPAVGECAVCHARTSERDGGIAAPALHVNGVIDVTEPACNACHGETDDGAPAGAHQRHLRAGAHSRPVTCAECHLVPPSIARANPEHANGGPAEVAPSAGWAGATCTNSCHRAASPDWSAVDVNLGCTGCHGAPPPAPHPPVSNCALCHANSTGPQGRDFIDPMQHVNGVVEHHVSAACDGCHGSAGNAAPPRDTAGQTSTSLASVGAHQAHVVGRGLARKVECAECHRVPAQTVADGHLNGRVEVRFAGVALANVAQPVWTPGTASCANTACHDISNYTAAPGGGLHTTPRWTLVDQSQATCSACHGLPPPLPHVQREDCEACHANATPQRTFVRPELHVNGHVDFAAP